MFRRRFVAAWAVALLTVGVAGVVPAGAESPGAPATGSINPVDGASLVSGDTFTLGDGFNADLTFEFRSSGTAAPGNVQITFSASDNAATIRTKIRDAINNEVATLDITAVVASSGLVQLTNDHDGIQGNQLIFENVTDPDFTVSGMSGGTNSTNASPVLAPIGDRAIAEGDLLQIVVSATDGDGDTLTYSVLNPPAGASFDPATRTLTWTPGPNQAGSYADVRFQVTDGVATDFEDVTLTVYDVPADDPGVVPDTTAPETTLSGPKKTKKPTAKFRFSSSEPGSSFECRLDEKAFAPCTSPKKLKRLKEGKHTFSVRAIDAAGNPDPTPAKKRFKVKLSD